jgi:peptidoglycan/LPS O-acetylase OafA/YrhL
MISSNRLYLPRVDILRALAAWWVFLFHAFFSLQAVPDPTGERAVTSFNPFIVIVSQGWMAVTLFIVISGFCLGQGLAGKEINWKGYFCARWLRVAPLYLLIVFFAILLAKPEPDLVTIFGTMTLLPLPHLFKSSHWLDVFWSVRVEFLLYFSLPLLVYLSRSIGLKKSVLSVYGFFSCVVLLLLLGGARGSTVFYWSFVGRFGEFAAGFFLGYFGCPKELLNKVVIHKRTLSLALACFSLVLLFVFSQMGGFYSVSLLPRIGLYVFTILVALLALFWASMPSDSSDSSKSLILSRLYRFLQSLGAWSYSTYMWHAIIIALLGRPLYKWVRFGLLHQYPLDYEFFGIDLDIYLFFVLFPIIAVFTAIFSKLSFEVIEKPFLSFRPSYVNPTK